MSHEALSVLVAAIGGFLLGWNPWARRDSKRLDWYLRQAGQSRHDVDAAMAAEAAHDAH